MPAWLVPTLGYVVLLGAAGVTTRLALRTITWEQMVLWVPVAYLTFAVILAAARGAREDPPRATRLLEENRRRSPCATGAASSTS